MEYAVSKGSLSTLTAGDKSVVTSSYKFVKNNSKTALVWSAADDEGSHIYASIKTDKGWSSPISLFISEDAIQFMDVELMNNGEWKVIANILQKVGDDSKNSLVL